MLAICDAGRLIDHRPLCGVRTPDKRSLSCSIMWTASLSKWTLQPLLHSCPTESSEAEDKFGKMWHSVASDGRSGKLMFPEWLDWMVAPSGRCTWRLVDGVSGRILLMGVPGLK